MYNVIIKDEILKKSCVPGSIEIIDSDNKVLDAFENDLESVDSDHKDLKPGNFLIINNPHFKITFSCNYIHSWVSRGKMISYNKKKQRYKLVHNHQSATINNHKK